jgi:hypothetical protein
MEKTTMAQSVNRIYDRSVTSVANASTLLLDKVAYRVGWRCMAPVGADIWINPAGGIAGPSLTGCFLVKAGTIFGSQPDITENGVINYWCATANLVIPVVTYY